MIAYIFAGLSFGVSMAMFFVVRRVIYEFFHLRSQYLKLECLVLEHEATISVFEDAVHNFADRMVSKKEDPSDEI